MKKILLSIALVLFAGATMAQSALEQGGIVTVSNLQERTERKIAIKNIDGLNNYWFSATESSGTLTGSEVFFWIPVEDSETMFYLKKACTAANEGYVILTNNATNQGGGAKSLGLGTKKEAMKFQAGTPDYSGTPVNTAKTGEGEIVRFYNENKDNWINCERAEEGPSFRNSPGKGTFTIHNVYNMDAYKLLTINYVKDGETTTEYALLKEGDEITVPSYEGYESDYTPTTKNGTDTQVITVNYSEPTPKFYTINLTPLYTNSDRTGASMYVHSDARLRCNRIAGELDAKNVFAFVTAADGKTYMKNIATQTYISRIGEDPDQHAIYADSETPEGAMYVNFNKLGEGTVDGETVEIIEIQPGNNAMLNCAEVDGSNNNSGRVVSFTPGSDKISKASAWYLTEVTEFSHTLNVGTSEWATLVLGFNATIPTNEGFKAYTIKEIDGESIKLIDATGILSANTPIIINAPQGDYTFEYTAEATTVTANGKLKGTLYDKNITEDAYVLTADANDANGVCFGVAKKNQTGNTAFKNNANKAYLPASAVPVNVALSASLRFDFDGNTTGVEEVEIRNEKEEIYDLTGRRVNEITKAGVYIIGGRKVLVK